MQRSSRQELISPKNDHKINYFDLLDKINANLVNDVKMRFINNRKVVIYKTKHLWIRHDVDHDLDKALTMARLESELGYYSTYFLLHTAPYWKNGDTQAMKELVRLGHGIGIHNNALAEWVRNQDGPKPITMIRNAKMRIEDITGRPVFFTSAHGDKLCREKGFCNYDMWFESPYPRGHFNYTEDIMHDFSSIERIGLMEAYFVRRDAYLTDTGYKWQGAINDEIPPFEKFDNPRGVNPTIRQFNNMQSGVMQLLVHPFWWEVE